MWKSLSSWWTGDKSPTETPDSNKTKDSNDDQSLSHSEGSDRVETGNNEASVSQAHTRMGEAKPQAGQPDSNKTEGSSISKGEQSLSHLKENEIVETEKGEAIVSHGQARSAELPAIIDVNKALASFMDQHEPLALIICHVISRVTGELYAKGIISNETRSKASNAMHIEEERTEVLLRAVESKIRVEPLAFKVFVQILESELYTKNQADSLIECYNKCTTPLQTTICHTSPDIGRYADYLKGVYENSSVCDDQKFPPTPSQKYVNLAVVNHKPRDIDEVMKYTLYGNVEELIENKEKISIEEILKPKDQSRLRLVLVEGPPGVGKSTLSWELCRRWDKIPHMREYSLVMLLRLRENSVQQAKAVADLFYHVDSDLQQSVVKEVVTTEGKGVLFILDGFDELPSGLRRNGLLIDLITGRALPKSTVIVTSRPSATADLLGKCRSQVQKRVEILGFTQECVKEYASTVFSSEPKLLDDFLAYISASNNPAINSLMYIPLNAAIIMELYRNSKRIGGPIPKTLTQLYSVLCLTLIQRYLDNEQPLNRFTDLTEKDYRHFLDLSEVAFHGIKEREVVFSSDRLSKNLVHFGFLDVVSSLYSGPGGGDSYNFLHLTVQEFLAAYHISQLPHQKGLELFEQHGRDGPWHVVWIFVAGLTGFELFKGISMKSEAFVNKTKDDKLNLSGMLIHCLYEAQINESEYSAIFEGSSNVEITFVHAPLDKYALGYCIARSPPTIFWDVGLYGGSSDSLIWGLRSRAKCKGIMKTLDLDSCFLSANLKECPTNILQSITHFCMKEDSFYKHDPAVYTHLCESIPSLCNLSTLKLRPQQPFQEADLIMLLDKISTSKVSYLIIGSLHHDILEKEQIILAMSKLIHPLSGTLQNLAIFQHVSKIIDTQTSLCTVLYNSSSLRELYVGFHNPSPLALLETNTCLTRITIECFWNKEHAESIASLLQKNTTLRCLILKFLHCQNQIELLKIITCNIEANTALQRFEFHTDGVNAILQELSRLKNDPRIHYHNYYTGECFYKHSLVSGKRILW